MKVEVNFDESLIDKQLTIGVDGGIQYWCSYSKLEFTSGAMEAFGKQFAIGGVVKDKQTGFFYILDVKLALKIAAERYPWLIDIQECDIDSGDMFIQLAAFGKIKYNEQYNHEL